MHPRLSHILCLWCLAGIGLLVPVHAEEPPVPMTLQQCLTYGSTHNPLLAGEQARVLQSKAIFTQTKANTALGMDLRASYLQYDELPPSKVQQVGAGDSDTLGELVVSKSLFSWGKWDARNTAAHFGVQMAQSQQERTYQDVMGSIAKAYAEFWLREQIAQAKGETLTQANAHLKLTTDLAALGKVAKVEVMRAEVNAATARDAQRRAARERDSARMRLNQMMGREPQLPIRVTNELAELMTPIIPAKESWTQHPEWQRLNLSVNQSRALVKAAEADKYPEVFAKGTYTGEGLRDITTVTHWNLGLEIRLPVLDGGRRHAVVHQAKAGQEAAAAQLEATRQRLSTEIADAQAALVDAEERQKDLRATTKLADQTLTISEERFRVGAGTALDVFDAQTALLQVKVAVSQATADVLQAKVQMASALGQRIALANTAEVHHE
ncbi:MAG: TolC family protein [Armatimonadota bacterium]